MSADMPSWRMPAMWETSPPRACSAAAGALVNQAHRDGFTPLIVASLHDFLEVVRFLVLERNATVDQASDTGLTALWFATLRGNVSVVRFLAMEGKAKGLAGALTVGACRGDVEIVGILLRAGADVAPCDPAFASEGSARARSWPSRRQPTMRRTPQPQ
jgi:hypothetical protein